MLKNFLPHWLSDHNRSSELIRRTDYWWRHPSTLRDGEVTQKRSKAAVDCVKIGPIIKNMKGKLMCESYAIELICLCFSMNCGMV
jgi:hypothetical protein